MLNIGLIVLLSVDLILLTYGKFRFYYVAIKKMISTLQENLKKQRESKPEVSDILNVEHQEENVVQESIKKNDSWIKKILAFSLKVLVFIIGVSFALVIFLITIGITTSSIWGTILLAIYTNFIYAAVYLIGIKLFFFLVGFGTHKVFKVDKSVTQRVLIMDTIQFSMLALLLYFAAFGFPIQVLDMVIIPYTWGISFNNLASIMVPMIFFSLIVVNVLAVTYRIKNVFTKNRNKHKLFRLHQLLFIFIASCFLGILYITDINLSFMDEVRRTMYLQTLEVVKWIITSVFIPLFMFTLNNFKISKSIE